MGCCCWMSTFQGSGEETEALAPLLWASHSWENYSISHPLPSVGTNHKTGKQGTANLFRAPHQHLALWLPSNFTSAVSKIPPCREQKGWWTCSVFQLRLLQHLKGKDLIYFFGSFLFFIWGTIKSLIASQVVQNPLTNVGASRHARPPSLGWEDPLKEEMATHSSVVLPGKVHGQRSLVGLQSTASQSPNTTEQLSTTQFLPLEQTHTHTHTEKVYE